MYTKESILLKFKDIHGDVYDYSRMKYTRTRDKIEIICKVHGVFLQTPHKHIAGSGCPECGIIKASKTRTLNKKEFYNQCTKIHHGKYSYLNDYIHSHKHITITCPIHGDFRQIANGHLKGQGCLLCARESHPGGYSNLDKDKLSSISPAFLYHITLKSNEEIFDKVGVTIDTKRRFYEFSRYYNLFINNIVEYKTMLEAYNKEQEILSNSIRFRPKIKFFGHTECIERA